MKSKVVLITGGSSGIGKAIGNYLAKKGLQVYGTTRDLGKYPNHENFELVALDVNNEATIEKAVQSILLKEGRLDILINNAGVGITGPIEETPNEEILKAFETNFNGPIRMIKAVLPQMRSQSDGLIINVTSIAGHMGLPFRGVYSATKGALALLTETLRMEVKDFGVKIVNIAPGDFATNIAAGRYHAPLKKESPYLKTYGKTLNAINEDVTLGKNPMDVAIKVYQIIQKDTPKVTYTVGAFLQRFSLLLKKILPSKIYEKILLNHYKL
jgi:NAD(P)-dependent dehydrogenase (short-subunit alcohol dehydrogenase family)